VSIGNARPAPVQYTSDGYAYNENSRPSNDLAQLLLMKVLLERFRKNKESSGGEVKSAGCPDLCTGEDFCNARIYPGNTCTKAMPTMTVDPEDRALDMKTMVMFSMLQGDDEVTGCAYECACAAGWSKVTGENGFDTCITLPGVATADQPATFGCPGGDLGGDPCLARALTASNACETDTTAPRGYRCSCNTRLFKQGPDGNSCLLR
jgi:hypothetical protein